MPWITNAFDVRYMAYNLETGEPVIGDSANHTINYILAGANKSLSSFTGTIVEINSVSCPGLYKFNIAYGTDTSPGGILTVYVKSSTAGVIIPPIQIPIEEYGTPNTIWNKTISSGLSTNSAADYLRNMNSKMWRVSMSDIGSTYTNSTNYISGYIKNKLEGIDTNTSSGGSSISAADVWEYSGDRTLTANTNLNIPTASSIADAVLEENLSSHSTTGTLGKKITDIPTSTYSVPTASTIASSVWGSATRTLTANTNLSIPTASTIAGAVLNESLSTHSTAGTLGKKISDIPTNVYTIPTVSQIQSGLATSGDITTALDTYGVAKTTDVTALDIPTVQEIQVGLAKTSDITALDIPTVSEIADSVWDESLTGHTNSGTMGYYNYHGDYDIPSASSVASSVWGAGTRTLTANTNLNIPTVSAIQSGLATSSEISALDIPTVQEIQSGLAKTSELPTVPTAGAIANQVWNEAIANHVTIGSTGAKLNTLENSSGSGGATAQEVWEYSGGRTITNNIPTVAQIQSGLAKTSDIAGLNDLSTSDLSTALTNYGTAKTTDVTGISIPSASTIASNVWNSALSGYTSSGTAGKKLNDLQNTDISGLSTFDPSTDSVIINSEQAETMTTAVIPTDYAKTTDITGLDIPTVSEIKAGVWGNTTRTLTSNSNLNIPTVSQIQNGLAKSSEIPSVPTVAQIKAGVWGDSLSGYTTAGTAGKKLLDLQNTNISTLAKSSEISALNDLSSGEISAVLNAYNVAKTSDIPDISGLATSGEIPTVQEIQNGLAKTSDIAGLNDLSSSDITSVLNNYGAAKTSELPTVPTVAQIQSGLATSSQIQALNNLSSGDIGTALITYGTAKTTDLNNLATSAEISALNIPTIEEIQNGLAKTSELPIVPTVSEIQNGLAKTSELPDISGLATSAEISALNIPTINQISDQVWNESLSGHVNSGSTGKKLNDMNSGSGGSISAADVWAYSQRTLTSGGTSGITIADVETALDNYGTAKTSDIPTVATIQSGLAKTSDIESLNIPTVAQIQTGLAKSSELPTVAQIATGVWSNSTRTITSGGITINDVQTALTSYGAAKYTDLPDVPTVSEIQNGLATVNDIPTVTEIQNGLATSSEIQALEIPTVAQIQTGLAKTSDIPIDYAKTSDIEGLNIPTVLEIQTGLAKSSELPNISGLATSAQISALNIPTVQEIQSGLAKTVDITGLDIPDISGLATTSDIANLNIPTVQEIQSGLAKTSDIPSVPTLSEISEEIWGAETRTLTSEEGEGITIADIETALDNYGTAKTSDIPTVATISEGVWSADDRTLTAGNASDSINTLDATKTAIESQYIGLADVYNYESSTDLDNVTSTNETQTYSEIPCRLSFISYTASSPVYQGRMPEIVKTNVKLFTKPEYNIPAGSKIVVTQNGETESYKCSSITNMYATHQEIKLIPWEDYA